MQKDENLTIQELQKGDHNAFEYIFKSYYRLITLFANRFVNDLSISQEIAGDVFAALWEKREQMDVSVSLKSYLFKMTQNRCLNYLKHKQIENLYINYLQRSDLLASQPADFEKAFHNKDIALQIKTAVDSLPPQCRAVFTLSRYEHLKYREIAEKLCISEKTVERHMSLAFEKLRQLLKYDLFKDPVKTEHR
ncbi:RNA polymerase sigma-70 factor [Mucilaginibacter conchicola]|nr:RNA polymerase sigma-70 factor [Mucilaginibacter conchicola]